MKSAGMAVADSPAQLGETMLKLLKKINLIKKKIKNYLNIFLAILFNNIKCFCF